MSKPGRSTFALALVGAGTAAAADASGGPWQLTYHGPWGRRLPVHGHGRARSPGHPRRLPLRLRVAELACYALAGSERAKETPRLTQVESSSSVATSSESTRSQTGSSR